MKPFIYLYAFICSLQILSGQIITSVPAFPTAQDSIIIYYDANRGDQGLMDYNGSDVYAHTGVITENSTQPSDWRYVIAGWNKNIHKAKLTEVSDNFWKLTIGYIRDYYIDHETGNSIPPDEEVLRLAFVFRNSDGSHTGKAADGGDIFYDLYKSGLTVIINSPSINVPFQDPARSPLFAELSDTLHIQLSAATINTEIDSLYLMSNNQLLAQVQDTLLTYELVLNTFSHGMQQVQAVGLDTAGIADTSSFYFMINPPVVESQPPADLHDGINYRADNSIILFLFAPYKDFVYVIGDFNDWRIDTTYFMQRYMVNADSVYYWLKIDGLDPDTEYGFQYLVNGEIRIADPYTEKILDEWNDQYITATTYPNLKSYPTGKTEELVGLINPKATQYEWQTTDYTRPQQTDLVIYELLIRDFLAAHDYQTLIDTLDYLQNLGINAIELMPVNEFEGNQSWGYNPCFYFAPDKYYGPASDLKRFIDTCHQRNIAVILDMVLNHSTGQSPLVRLYNDGKYGSPTEDNPWFNQTARHPYNVFYDMNHESQATQYFVDRVNEFWLKEYKVDGYRFDLSKGFTQRNSVGNVSLWGQYDASRITLLKRMADHIWSQDSSVYVILEHFADNSEEEELANYGMLLWGNANWNYAQSAMGYSDQSDFSWGYFGNRGWDKAHVVTYMESHDEERLMYKNLQYGNSSNGYNIQELNTALNRMKLATAFFLTYPGPKMIWQFGELGYDYSINYNGRTGLKPIRWNYFHELARRKLYKTYQALLELRKSQPVFTNPETIVNMDVDGAAKRISMYGSPHVVIIGNFDVDSLNINPQFTHGGQWYDYFSGDSLYIMYTTDPIALAPGEFHIFTDTKLPPPEPGILSEFDPYDHNIPKTFQLLSNYPNPFNSTTTIPYTLDQTADMELRIFDITGREIFTQIKNHQPPGYYRCQWKGLDNNGRQLHSGIYFVILSRAGEQKIQKITLLK